MRQEDRRRKHFLAGFVYWSKDGAKKWQRTGIYEVNTETDDISDESILQNDDTEEKWKSDSDALQEREQLLLECGINIRESSVRFRINVDDVENVDGEFSVGKIDDTPSFVRKRRNISDNENSDDIFIETRQGWAKEAQGWKSVN